MHITYDKKNGIKRVTSENYNYHFDMKSGEFHRWGKTMNDDPVCGPLEIADIEVGTSCDGIPNIGSNVPIPCSFCYKGNNHLGENMSFNTFKNIFDKLPKTLTQIAFGIGNLSDNKDLVKMFDYCRNNEWNPGVVPNLTINGWGLTDEWVTTLAKHLGGIAISAYANKDVCYDAVKKMTDAGIIQTNIHKVVSRQSLDSCYTLIDDVVSDPRLAKLKAIVFLTMKPKGSRNKWDTLKDVGEYRKLIDYAMKRNVGIGFDSCSAKTFLVAMKDHPQFKQFCQLAESCESTLFSGYLDVKGHFFPCSFTEGEGEWKEGIDVTAAEDFDADVWNHPKVAKFRADNIATTDERICGDCRACVTFPDLYDPAISKVIPIIAHSNKNIGEKITLLEKLGLL